MSNVVESMYRDPVFLKFQRSIPYTYARLLRVKNMSEYWERDNLEKKMLDFQAGVDSLKNKLLELKSEFSANLTEQERLLAIATEELAIATEEFNEKDQRVKWYQYTLGLHSCASYASDSV